MITRVQVGDVIDAEFLSLINAHAALVELGTMQKAVLSLGNNPRSFKRREEFQVEVTDVTPGSREDSIQVRETVSGLTSFGASASAVARTSQRRPVPVAFRRRAA